MADPQKPEITSRVRIARLTLFACGATLAGTCLIVGWSQHLIGPLWNDLIRFLTGDGLSIGRREASITEVLMNGLAAVVVTVPLAVLGALIVVASGAHKKIDPGPRNLFHESAERPAPKGALAIFMALNKVACIVLLEEFYARWIFLGLLAGLSAFSGPNGLYVLFLLGNTAWTALHYFNYKKDKRTVLVLSPVFLIGLLQAVMFLRYGLLGSFISHLAWDYVLMIPRWCHQMMRRSPLTL